MRIAIFIIVAALASATAPLLVYTTTLALFGLAHVLVELRYVDARFGRRTSRELQVGAGLLLAAVVVVRALRLAGYVGDAHPYIELALVTALATLALPALFRAGKLLLGVVVVGALAFGAVVAPSLTLVTLAVLHNATPIGFLVEASPRPRRTLLYSTLAFVGAPLFVALFARHSDAAILSAGPLAHHLYVYVPQPLLHWDGAVNAFAAVVCAQVLHYGAVIFLMPRNLTASDVPLIPWPAWSRFVVVIVVLSAGLLVHFSMDFIEARAVYGLAAAVHAWIEVPILLLIVASARTKRVPR